MKSFPRVLVLIRSLGHFSSYLKTFDDFSELVKGIAMCDRTREKVANSNKIKRGVFKMHQLFFFEVFNKKIIS